jgi:hypothetical protein
MGVRPEQVSRVPEGCGRTSVPGETFQIELDEDAFAPVDRDSLSGSDVWRHPDGSVAEW